MYLHKKSIFLFIILITNSIFPFTAVNANAQILRPLLSNFQSYIDIEYDDEPLNEFLRLEKSINIPLTIKYSTDIPSNFLQYMPWRLKNYILFGNMNAPQQSINLSILYEPDWVDISLSSNQFSVSIPNEEESVEISTSITITLISDAPARPYIFKIEGSCSQIGRINSTSTQTSIVFTPEYKPDLAIFQISKKTFKLSYDQDTNTFFEIKCLANHNSIITPIVKNAPENVNITFTPKYRVLNSEEQDIFCVNISAEPSFKEKISIVLSATMDYYPLNDEFSTFESNETISYLLIPPKQNDEELSLNINLILNIVLTVIIVLLIINFKWKKWW